MKNIKDISIFAIPYFFLCGGLYHLTYWSTFNINGLSFISISNIIKSSIYPIVVTLVFVVIGIILGESIFRFDKYSPPDEGRETKIGKKLNSNIAITIFLVLWISALIFLYLFGTSERWILWAFIFSSVPIFALDRIRLWKNDFENHNLRMWTIRILIWFPTFSFAVGKYNCELVYRNIDYKFTTTHNIEIFPRTNAKSDTIKLIGYTEKYIFFTDLENTKTYMIKPEKLEFIELLVKK